MTGKVLFSIAIAASSLFVQVLPAASSDRPILACIDRNGDGIIALSEIAALRAWRFDRLDRNNDGVLIRREFGWHGWKFLRDRMIARDAAHTDAPAPGRNGLALLGCKSGGQR